MVNITRRWTHIHDSMFFNFHDRKILQSCESFGKQRQNLLVASDARDS